MWQNHKPPACPDRPASGSSVTQPRRQIGLCGVPPLDGFLHLYQRVPQRMSMTVAVLQ